MFASLARIESGRLRRSSAVARAQYAVKCSGPQARITNAPVRWRRVGADGVIAALSAVGGDAGERVGAAPCVVLLGRARAAWAAPVCSRALVSPSSDRMRFAAGLSRESSDSSGTRTTETPESVRNRPAEAPRVVRETAMMVTSAPALTRVPALLSTRESFVAWLWTSEVMHRPCRGEGAWKPFCGAGERSRISRSP